MAFIALLTLPLPPNLANSRLHWRAKHRKRQQYFQQAALALMAQPLTRYPVADLVKLDATLYVWQFMDADNAVARLKWTIDALVQNGYLVNDDQSHLELGTVRQRIDRKQQRVDLRLEAIG
jgi:hypothetical protein